MVTVSLSFRRSGRDSLCEFLTTQQLIMTLHSVPLQFKKSIKALTLFLILISIRPNLGMLIPNRTSRNTTLETDSAPFLSSGKGNGTESNREGRMSGKTYEITRLSNVSFIPVITNPSRFWWALHSDLFSKCALQCYEWRRWDLLLK